jgi:DNA-directed DNA polymerase III PolC
MYLNCKTYYSFRYGTFSTQELVHTASGLGVAAMALTNINTTCDIWDFVKCCGDQGIKPIAGVEIRNGHTLEYILLAANNKGFGWINNFLSAHLEEKKKFPEMAEVTPFFADSLDGFVIYPLGKKTTEQLFSNERIGVLPSEINKLWGIGAEALGDKYVIRQPVTCQHPQYYNLHKLLRAIDLNIVGTKLTEEHLAGKDEFFRPPAHLWQGYQQYPSLIAATCKLIDACSITMDFNADKNKKFYTASKEDDRRLLEKLATEGLKKRYGTKNKIAVERLMKELKIISDLGFNSYFLINWDMIRYAQSRGFYYVGRGSGANSIVAYCLTITNVDPIELNLYFERFLNPHRTSPPDFDIDFSHNDRNEVIDYVFKRYGKEHVCLLGSYSTFKNDSSIRELCKVFGIPDAEVEELQDTHQPKDSIQAMILQYARRMEKFPNYNSIHACGILITEEPIRNYLATFMPPKEFATAQMDMYGAESIGINKFDVLSQRGLSHIRTTQEIIFETRGIHIDIGDFERFRHDEAVKHQIQIAETIGCFYIESPAMRQLLKKLRCDDYQTLVAASSIIRPGVAQSGMMRAYIERYNQPSLTQYLHPLFEEHLSETFGVMVFQEDVIKIAHYFAGLDLGEADILRRAMSLTKYKANNSFDIIREKFFANCKELGHPEPLAAEVWRQMQSFAGYSFNKAHSASYAVESYMSLYLKTHYPVEFMVGVINNFGGFYPTALYFFELLKQNVKIIAPCVNISDAYTKIHNGEIYTGLVHIKSLQEKLRERILEERRAFGPYLHLQDFIERTDVPKKQLNILISSGCFAFTGKSKKLLLNEANLMQPGNKNHVPARLSLFDEPPVKFQLPALIDHPLDDIYDQLENLGFPLVNPFGLADAGSTEYVYAKDLPKYINQYITVMIYFIAYKVVPTAIGDPMSFGTFIDPELNWIDTVHFPESFKKFPINKSGFYRARGKVVSDFGACSLEVTYMEKIGNKLPSYAGL